MKEEQEEPEPQHISESEEESEPQPSKEEQGEVWILQDEELLVLKQETNSSIVTPAYVEILPNVPELQQMIDTNGEPVSGQIKEEQEEPEPVQFKEEQEDLCSYEQLVVKEETDTFIITFPSDQNHNSNPEPNKDRLLSANSAEAQNQHQEGTNQGASRSKKELKPEKRRQKSRYHADNVDNLKLKRHETNLSSCELCGKCFSQPRYLSAHMGTHTAEKPFLCLTCGKGFRRQPDLTLHMRTHTGEKPFQCLVCGKGFIQKTTLSYHMRTHTGEPTQVGNLSHVQLVEESSTNNSWDLARHLRTHTGRAGIWLVTVEPTQVRSLFSVWPATEK
ncbi:hypothetical protein ILYODFUR_029278 [Ilyodon furcidens]|uniref:C2H2-type domain-containing protein n=1 Tax=Ilyodon furcidens TaxID=33524 RepID=A0ABV0UDL8_9TELE